MVGVPGLTATRALRSVATGLICGVCLLASGTVSASPLFSASVAVQNMNQQTSDLPTPVSLALPDGSYGAVDGGGSATASGGLSLAASTAVHAASTIGIPAQVEADATASFANYDVIVSGPSGASTTMSLNLIFHGLLTGGSGPAGDFGADALVGTNFGGLSQGGAAFAAGGFFGTGASGLLSGWINGSTFHITTGSIPVMSGDDVVIDLSLGDKAACGLGALTCTASANFGDTLSFPTGAPVFNLPAGWTVNSLDGSIVNNMLVAVPEPATGLLVMLGVLGLAMSRRRASVSE